MYSSKRKYDLSIYKKCPVKCFRATDPPSNLSEYLEMLDSLKIAHDVSHWYRGHANLLWKLAPSALRYKNPKHIKSALNLLIEFRRIADFRIDRPPPFEEELKWMQWAQHYGLPTRLLDWTTNAAVALYFACLRPDKDGLVFIMDPISLNSKMLKKEPRLMDPEQDKNTIKKYISLTERLYENGCYRTIAIKPIINNERIQLQRGVFTLHGNRTFELSSDEEPSLCYIPILAHYKRQLYDQLCVIGIDEMSIFPEHEHLCRHLKRMAELPEGG